MEKRVSVIVPTFQRGDLIGRALASVFSQRGIGEWSIEAVIIDDGSTDDTAAVVEAFEVPPPHCITYRQISHIGRPGLVRNAGLDIAQGELIGYCDSDDIWLPHHLATCLRQFELYPDTIMVETWWSFQQLHKGLRRWQINYASLSTDGRTTTTNSRIHRRSVLEKVGRFNELSWGEDIDLWTRIGFVGPIRRVKVPTTAHSYTRGGNNITFSFVPELARQYGAEMTGGSGAHAPTEPRSQPTRRGAPAQQEASEAPGLIAALRAELADQRQHVEDLRTAYEGTLAHERAMHAIALAELSAHTQSATPAGDVAIFGSRRWRRRVAFAIEHPRSAALLIGRRLLPASLKHNRSIRYVAAKILRLPLN